MGLFQADAPSPSEWNDGNPLQVGLACMVNPASLDLLLLVPLTHLAYFYLDLGIYYP